MDAEINSKPIYSSIKYTDRYDEMIFSRSSIHRQSDGSAALEGPTRWYALNYNIKATEIKQTHWHGACF